MNRNLIIKTIKAANEECPEFVYSNPLLDKNVAKALSKSFVKILNLSNQNSKINNNLRFSILENIRRICSSGPQNHVTADEELIETLSELYKKHTINTFSSNADPIEKQLDAFLVRQLKEMDVHSSFTSTLNLETVQALINLNSDGVYFDMLSKDTVYWHLRNGNYICVLRDLWDYKLHHNKMFDSIALKSKPEIEKLLLHICVNVLIQNENRETIFETNTALNELVQKCASSPICFQISSGILNFIFIMSNFEPQIRMFISTFVSKIKAKVAGTMFLYPLHLNHLVILLDFDINILPNELKPQYVTPTINYLQKLYEESENDFILMLSHYPQWFDIYYNENDRTQT